MADQRDVLPPSGNCFDSYRSKIPSASSHGFTPLSFDAPLFVRGSDAGWSLESRGLIQGETAATWLGLQAAPRYAPLLERTLRVRLGVIGALLLEPVPADLNGEVSVQFGPTVPPSGEDGVLVWSQSLCTSLDGSRRFSASRATILLDGVFQ